jgi:hypothetical protein
VRQAPAEAEKAEPLDDGEAAEEEPDLDDELEDDEEDDEQLYQEAYENEEPEDEGLAGEAEEEDL